MSVDFAMLRARLSFAAVWNSLGCRGKCGKCVRSPLRDNDENPSFSVYRDESGVERFKDHGTNAGGDVIDFIAAVRGCDVTRAAEWATNFLGISTIPSLTESAPTKRRWSPTLRRGDQAELMILCERRGFGIEAMREAERRGFLHFSEMAGVSAWAVTDSRRQLIELRRLDGDKWPAFGSLAARKAHCIGSGKDWPIGIMEAEGFDKCALVEGSPDFVALFNFLLSENKEKEVAPLGVLGAASRRLSLQALSLLRGKTVCIYPHRDDAGMQACRAWALLLREVGANPIAFDLSGMITVNGKLGKDVADLCRICPACFEREPKFWSILP